MFHIQFPSPILGVPIKMLCRNQVILGTVLVDAGNMVLLKEFLALVMGLYKGNYRFAGDRIGEGIISYRLSGSGSLIKPRVCRSTMRVHAFFLRRTEGVSEHKCVGCAYPDIFFWEEIGRRALCLFCGRYSRKTECCI